MDPLARHDARRRGREERRIEPAAREYAHGHVRHQLALDRPEQHVAQRGRRAEPRRARGDGGGVPVAAYRQSPAVGDEEVRRCELRDAVEHRVGRGDVAERAVQGCGRGVHAARLVGIGEQRLDLRREPQLAVPLRPKQRLLASAVARENQPFVAVVPYRQAEHPLEPSDAVRAEAFIQRHDRLDVARRAERIACEGLLAAQLRGVVDLAVADHPDGAVRTLERLVAGGQVHDGEPAGPQPRALVAHDALAVGTAVGERGTHGGEAIGMRERGARERDGAEDAAHYRPPLPRRGGWGGWGGCDMERGRQGP